jgi:hypothetical protein
LRFAAIINTLAKCDWQKTLLVILVKLKESRISILFIWNPFTVDLLLVYFSHIFISEFNILFFKLRYLLLGDLQNHNNFAVAKCGYDWVTAMKFTLMQFYLRELIRKVYSVGKVVRFLTSFCGCLFFEKIIVSNENVNLLRWWEKKFVSAITMPAGKLNEVSSILVLGMVPVICGAAK